MLNARIVEANGIPADPDGKAVWQMVPTIYKRKSFTKLREAGRKVAELTRRAIPSNAHDLVDLFEQAGFFQAIAYGPLDQDSRLEQRAARDHTDILLRSFTGGLVALLQIEPPDTRLSETFRELADHARSILGYLPDTLALTNGLELWICPTTGGYLRKKRWIFNLSELDEAQAQILYRSLNQTPVDWGRHVRGPHL